MTIPDAGVAALGLVRGVGSAGKAYLNRAVVSKHSPLFIMAAIQKLCDHLVIQSLDYMLQPGYNEM
jgi:hypothetical protein